MFGNKKVHGQPYQKIYIFLFQIDIDKAFIKSNKHLYLYISKYVHMITLY